MEGAYTHEDYIQIQDLIVHINNRGYLCVNKTEEYRVKPEQVDCY
jgi:hypothetical protein